MALPISFNPNQPIPNDPFYSPTTYIVQGAYNPLIVGAGLSVDQFGVISSVGGGGGGVNTLVAGLGIGLSGPTGNVTVSNTGVTSIVPGPGISASAGTGTVTLSAIALGTVTTVSTGTGLTGGPITVSGTIALANTAVTPGTYTNPSIIVDAQGRITGASNGTAIGSVVGTSPINVSTVGSTSTVSINAASVTQAGAVQLSNSVSDTSITQAATSNAVKTAFDAAVAAIPKACITGKGALVSGTGASIPAPLPVGTNGQVLTADSTCATGLKWAAAGGVPSATPTVEGVVFGCTTATSTALGSNALVGVTGGTNNVAIGNQAGSAITTGSQNVAIGPSASVASATGNCQLAIGFSTTDNWITGVSTKAIKPGAGIIDCANTCGTANQVLVSTGANAVQWKSVNSAIGAPNYGNFISTVPQTPLALSTGQPVTLNNTVAASNFSVANGSEITAAAAGIYNLQFSIQIISTGGGGGDVEIWFAKNGSPIPNSNTHFSVKNVNEAEFAALNFIETLAAGDYLQIIWGTNNLNIQLATPTSTMGGPAVPSVIVTIVPVGA